MFLYVDKCASGRNTSINGKYRKFALATINSYLVKKLSIAC